MCGVRMRVRVRVRVIEKGVRRREEERKIRLLFLFHDKKACTFPQVHSKHQSLICRTSLALFLISHSSFLIPHSFTPLPSTNELRVPCHDLQGASEKRNMALPTMRYNRNTE